MASIRDTSNPNHMVLDMSGKLINLTELGRAAAEAVEKRHANDPKPSADAPLAEQVAWQMDHTPSRRDVDKALQDKYRKIIKKHYECNA